MAQKRNTLDESTVEKLTDTWDANAKILTVARSTKHPTAGKVTHVWRLNFDGLTDEQIVKYAARSVIIDFQRQLRDAPSADVKKWKDVTLNVVDLLTPRERKALTPAEQLERIRKAMGEDAFKAELAKFTK